MPTLNVICYNPTAYMKKRDECPFNYSTEAFNNSERLNGLEAT